MKFLSIRTDRKRAVRFMIEKVFITSIGFYASIPYIDEKIKHTSVTNDDFEIISDKK